MRSFVILAFLFSCQSLLAQRECASTQYVQEQKIAQPALEQQLISVENFIKTHTISSSEATRITGTTIVKIPVVIHVLYNNASQNISDEQVRSQIDALNRDFRRRNTDTSNTPLAFRDAAADVMIEFVLATADPSGRKTSGIIRKQTSVADWKMDDKIKFSSQGGNDAWDSRYYLNVWVGQMRSLLGYSSAPGAAPEKDGIVIATSAFGTIGKAAPYHLGRTLVHEVGHWLGLRHIWGDTYCGNDLVSDTPKQGGFTTGCPTGYRSTCSNNGDMFMNYMDFTDDACMNLFTNGQKERMRSHFYEGGPRNAMLNSKGLHAPWSTGVAEVSGGRKSFSVYPNPAQHQLVIELGGDNRFASYAEIVSLNGVVVKKERITGSATTVNLQGLAAGMYYIQVRNGEQLLRQKFVRL